MKINCKNCGKRFDYEKQGGTCPKCGTVQTASQHVASELASNQRTTAKPEPRKKSNKAVTIILLVSMLLVVVMPLTGKHILHLIHIDKLTIKETPETEYYSIGEEIPFSSENVSITITDIDNSKDIGIVAPEGYEFITLSYNVQDHTNPENSYTPIEIYSGARIYLKTQSGCYLSSLSSYSLIEELGLTYNEGSDLGISTHFEHSTGTLYFLTKENDAKSLLINYHDISHSRYSNDAPLARVIEIQDLEVNQ